MARKIVVLHTDKGPGGDLRATGVFWLTTPSSMVFADATRISGIPSTAPWSLVAGELTALTNGTVTELPFSTQIAAGSTIAQLGAQLVTEYNAQQTALNNRAISQDFAGSSWDGTTWTPVHTP